MSPPGADPESRPGTLRFRCNICGATNECPPEEIGRETRSCSCGSTARWRAVVHVLSTELFGTSLTLDDFPTRKDVRGLGLSDSRLYAEPLARKFSYVNTFLDEAPKLDITAADPALDDVYDFVIASDVFEHVPPPVERAFANVRRILKPSGFLVLTVPYTEEGATVEHFPALHRFEFLERSGLVVLRNVRSDGTVEEFDDLVFHDGPGLTLEMRRFAKPGLVAGLHAAGFADVEFLSEPFLPYGVYWPARWSLPCVARRMRRPGAAATPGPALSVSPR